jgi:hypothetical protein
VDSVSEDRIAIYNRKTTQGLPLLFLSRETGLLWGRVKSPSSQSRLHRHPPPERRRGQQGHS